ncbi:MAG: hypothetical protein Q8R16_00300, partial [bacterium]|nr:hypothetical protein [bacterium]
TVTAVDGDRVWAFGHPMTQAGPTTFPFSAAEVMAVAANPTFGSYKVASPAGALLGAITDDRAAAIAGRFGPTPPMVGVRTDSTYLGAVQETNHETALVADPFGTAQFAAFALVWPITVQRDRVASGSIAYDITVTVRETDLVGHRRDVISSSYWAESNLFFDLLFRLADLIGNSSVPLTIERVELTADVSDDRRELTIDDVDVADRIAPGDELVVAVQLLQFGTSELVTQALVIEIPSDFPAGPATLEVGPETALGMPSVEPSDEEEDDRVPDTAEDIIAAFNALPRQQVLVARLTSLAAPPMPECPPCAEDTPCEPCELPPPSDEPPPPPPSLQAIAEEDGMVLGFDSRTIEVVATP